MTFFFLRKKVKTCDQVINDCLNNNIKDMNYVGA